MQARSGTVHNAPRSSDNSPDYQRLFKIALFPFGIAFTLFVPIIVGLSVQDVALPSIAALCGAFVTVMARFEDLTEFALGPLKAKLEKKVNEADEILEKLRDVACVMVDATLTDLCNGTFFFGGMTIQQRLDYKPKLVELLERIGASQGQIEEALNGWREVVSKIYVGHISKGVDNLNEPELKKKFESRQAEAHSNGGVLRPCDISEIISSSKSHASSIQGWIKDYQHFLDSGKIRRYEEFVRE
jgi:hypothetical protein